MRFRDYLKMVFIVGVLMALIGVAWGVVTTHPLSKQTVTNPEFLRQFLERPTWPDDVLYDSDADVEWDKSLYTWLFHDNAILGFGNTAASPDVKFIPDGTNLDVTIGSNMTFGDGGTTNYVKITSTGGIQSYGTADITSGDDMTCGDDFSVVGDATLGGKVQVTASGGTGMTAHNFNLMRTYEATVDVNDDDADCDYEFDDDAANETAQEISIGVLPPFTQIVTFYIANIEAVAGGAENNAQFKLSTTASGAEIMAQTAFAALDDVNDIVASTAGDAPDLTGAGATGNTILLECDPNDNWNTLTEGEWHVFVTYLDYGAIKE